MNACCSWEYRRRLKQRVALILVHTAVLLVITALVSVIGFIGWKGYSVLSWEFLTESPRNSMTEGGIFPALLGTLLLTIGAFLTAFPLGLGTAIYLNEFAHAGSLVTLIRFAVTTLAGVPSVVLGLFGLALFVVYCGFGSSLLSGSLTLGLLILPVIIGASEEALKAVPMTYREAAQALGASKWQTVARVVLPAALPGILTGTILGIGRAAGETAPIMFTAAAFYASNLPSSVLDEVMALPYHIYVLATAGTQIEQTRPIQYGAALVLLGLVLGINAFAILWRARLRRVRSR